MLQVSRAHALVDEASSQLAEVLPPEIMERTSAIDQGGGLRSGAQGTQTALPLTTYLANSALAIHLQMLPCISLETR